MGGAKASCANPFKSLYDIQVKTATNETVSLSKYKGKVLFIVNVASQWDLTDEYYDDLIRIEQDYRYEGVEILAFPCNQFHEQEPGTDQEILQFIRNKRATFEVFSKIDVNGKNASDLYKFLRLNSSLKGNTIGWNFGKFIVNRDASEIKYFVPKKSPKKIVVEMQKFL